MTIKIKYVGKKPFAYDNVARSGKVWAGNGDVQEVKPDEAKMLLKYPDQWALVEESDAEAVNTPETTKVEDEQGNDVEVNHDNLRKPLENMTKTELAAYAMAKFGKKLDARKSSKDLIDAIEEFERDLEPIKNVG